MDFCSVLARFLWIMCLFTVPCTSSSFFNTKPVEITIRKVTDCENDYSIPISVRIKKITRNVTAYDMNVTLPFVVGDSAIGGASVKKWAEGGWKENVFGLERRDPCGLLVTFLGELFFKVQDQLHMKRGCPFVPGFYKSVNHIVKWEEMKLRLWFLGRMQAKLWLSMKGVVKVCKVIEAELKPMLYVN